MALIEHTIAGAQDSALLWSKDSYESNFLETSLLFEGKEKSSRVGVTSICGHIFRERRLLHWQVQGGLISIKEQWLDNPLPNSAVCLRIGAGRIVDAFFESTAIEAVEHNTDEPSTGNRRIASAASLLSELVLWACFLLEDGQVHTMSLSVRDIHSSLLEALVVAGEGRLVNLGGAPAAASSPGPVATSLPSRRSSSGLLSDRSSPSVYLPSTSVNKFLKHHFVATLDSLPLVGGAANCIGSAEPGHVNAHSHSRASFDSGVAVAAGATAGEGDGAAGGVSGAAGAEGAIARLVLSSNWVSHNVLLLGLSGGDTLLCEFDVRVRAAASLRPSNRALGSPSLGSTRSGGAAPHGITSTNSDVIIREHLLKDRSSGLQAWLVNMLGVAPPAYDCDTIALAAIGVPADVPGNNSGAASAGVGGGCGVCGPDPTAQQLALSVNRMGVLRLWQLAGRYLAGSASLHDLLDSLRGGLHALKGAGAGNSSVRNDRGVLGAELAAAVTGESLPEKRFHLNACLARMALDRRPSPRGTAHLIAAVAVQLDLTEGGQRPGSFLYAGSGESAQAAAAVESFNQPWQILLVASDMRSATSGSGGAAGLHLAAQALHFPLQASERDSDGGGDWRGLVGVQGEDFSNASLMELQLQIDEELDSLAVITMWRATMRRHGASTEGVSSSSSPQSTVVEGIVGKVVIPLKRLRQSNYSQNSSSYADLPVMPKMSLAAPSAELSRRLHTTEDYFYSQQLLSSNSSTLDCTDVKSLLLKRIFLPGRFSSRAIRSGYRLFLHKSSKMLSKYRESRSHNHSQRQRQQQQQYRSDTLGHTADWESKSYAMDVLSAETSSESSPFPFSAQKAHQTQVDSFGAGAGANGRPISALLDGLELTHFVTFRALPAAVLRACETVATHHLACELEQQHAASETTRRAMYASLLAQDMQTFLDCCSAASSSLQAGNPGCILAPSIPLRISTTQRNSSSNSSSSLSSNLSGSSRGDSCVDEHNQITICRRDGALSVVSPTLPGSFDACPGAATSSSSDSSLGGVKQLLTLLETALGAEFDIPLLEIDTVVMARLQQMRPVSALAAPSIRAHTSPGSGSSGAKMERVGVSEEEAGDENWGRDGMETNDADANGDGYRAVSLEWIHPLFSDIVEAVGAGMQPAIQLLRVHCAGQMRQMQQMQQTRGAHVPSALPVLDLLLSSLSLHSYLSAALNTSIDTARLLREQQQSGGIRTSIGRNTTNSLGPASTQRRVNVRQRPITSTGAGGAAAAASVDLLLQSTLSELRTLQRTCKLVLALIYAISLTPGPGTDRDVDTALRTVITEVYEGKALAAYIAVSTVLFLHTVRPSSNLMLQRDTELARLFPLSATFSGQHTQSHDSIGGKYFEAELMALGSFCGSGVDLPVGGAAAGMLEVGAAAYVTDASRSVLENFLSYAIRALHLSVSSTAAGAGASPHASVRSLDSLQGWHTVWGLLSPSAQGPLSTYLFKAGQYASLGLWMEAVELHNAAPTAAFNTFCGISTTPVTSATSASSAPHGSGEGQCAAGTAAAAGEVFITLAQEFSPLGGAAFVRLVMGLARLRVASTRAVAGYLETLRSCWQLRENGTKLAASSAAAASERLRRMQVKAVQQALALLRSATSSSLDGLLQDTSTAGAYEEGHSTIEASNSLGPEMDLDGDGGGEYEGENFSPAALCTAVSDSLVAAQVMLQRVEAQGSFEQREAVALFVQGLLCLQDLTLKVADLPLLRSFLRESSSSSSSSSATGAGAQSILSRLVQRGTADSFLALVQLLYALEVMEMVERSQSIIPPKIGPRAGLDMALHIVARLNSMLESNAASNSSSSLSRSGQAQAQAHAHAHALTIGAGGRARAGTGEEGRAGGSHHEHALERQLQSAWHLAFEFALQARRLPDALNALQQITELEECGVPALTVKTTGRDSGVGSGVGSVAPWQQCLRALVVTACEVGRLGWLCSFPDVSLQPSESTAGAGSGAGSGVATTRLKDAIAETLHLLAAGSDLPIPHPAVPEPHRSQYNHQQHQQGEQQRQPNVNYHECLFTFLLSHRHYRAASQCMHAYAGQVELHPFAVHDAALLGISSSALATAALSLQVLPKDQQWFLLRSGPHRRQHTRATTFSSTSACEDERLELVGHTQLVVHHALKRALLTLQNQLQQPRQDARPGGVSTVGPVLGSMEYNSAVRSVEHTVLALGNTGRTSEALTLAQLCDNFRLHSDEQLRVIALGGMSLLPSRPSLHLTDVAVVCLAREAARCRAAAIAALPPPGRALGDFGSVSRAALAVCTDALLYAPHEQTSAVGHRIAGEYFNTNTTGVGSGSATEVSKQLWQLTAAVVRRLDIEHSSTSTSTAAAGTSGGAQMGLDAVNMKGSEDGVGRSGQRRWHAVALKAALASHPGMHFDRTLIDSFMGLHFADSRATSSSTGGAAGNDRREGGTCVGDVATLLQILIDAGQVGEAGKVACQLLQHSNKQLRARRGTAGAGNRPTETMWLPYEKLDKILLLLGQLAEEDYTTDNPARGATAASAATARRLRMLLEAHFSQLLLLEVAP